MTIEISLLLSGVSVAFAIFFGICSKQRNEKKDTQEDAEQRATTDTMVLSLWNSHSRVITRDWTENSIPTDNRRAGNGQESTSQKRGNT